MTILSIQEKREKKNLTMSLLTKLNKVYTVKKNKKLNSELTDQNLNTDLQKSKLTYMQYWSS